MRRLILIFAFSITLTLSGGSRSGDIATETTQFANGGILAIITAIDTAIREATELIEEYEELAIAVIENAAKAGASVRTVSEIDL